MRECVRRQLRAGRERPQEEVHRPLVTPDEHADAALVAAKRDRWERRSEVDVKQGVTQKIDTPRKRVVIEQ